LPLQAIEKDLWVTTILQLIFSLPVDSVAGLEQNDL
jgi:hypothetical protein